MTFYAIPDYAPALRGAHYVNDLIAQQIEDAVNARLEEIAGYVRGVEARAKVPVPRPPQQLTIGAQTAAGGGGHSDAWWHGVAICEQGGHNDAYYGYLSYMDGSAAGLSWEQQVAKGNQTIARYGDSAWAAACVAAGYRAAPNG